MEANNISTEYRDEFISQLKELINMDESQYKSFTPIGKKVLVRVFKFKPSRPLQMSNEVFLVKNELTGEYVPRTVSSNEKLYPIVKVIKPGLEAESWIKPNQLYIVPVKEITGSSFNDDFLHLLNSFGKEGSQGKIVNIPDGMPQRIQNIEKYWSSYFFSMPDKIGEYNDDEKLVYLIPSPKLEASYEPF